MELSVSVDYIEFDSNENKAVREKYTVWVMGFTVVYEV